MVSSGVSHNQKPWLPESCLDLIGECARGEPTVEGGGTSGSSKFQNGSLEWYSSFHARSCTWTLWMKCGSSHYKCQSQDSSPHASLKTEHRQFSTPPTPRHWHCCLVLTVCTLSLRTKNIYKFTCPVFLEEMTHTSAGFSMATMALAAKSSFSQVFFKLMMYTPKLMTEQRHFHI